ncbi:MAG: hypothetical protein QW303_02595 [Nitrososphaerota archaeon]
MLILKPATLFVLGAGDNEMRCIAQLLDQNFNIGWACKNGKKVNQTNAYDADEVQNLNGDKLSGDEAVLVGCGGQIAHQFQKVWTITHRSELPPRHFLVATPLGQVLLLLAAQGLLPGEWERRPIPTPGNGDPVFRGGRWIVPLRDGLGVCLPPSLVATAALKHCPESVLRGEIPGI